jgi:drug/metabolite transporter (DMT)-like permease
VQPRALPFGTADVLTVVASGSTYLAVPIALRGFSPTALTALRLGVATLVLGWMLLAGWRRGRARPRLDGRALIRVAIGGAVGFAGYSLLLNTGQQSVDPGTTSLLLNATPLFSAVLGGVLLRERQGQRGWAGLLIGFTGTGLVAFADGSGTLRLSYGALCVLGAALTVSIFTIVQQPILSRLGALEATAGAALAGLLCTCYALPDAVRGITNAQPSVLAAGLYLGIGSTAIGYTAWAASMRRGGVGDGTAILYAVPIVTIVLEAVLLGSHPSLLGAGGGLLAFGGVWLGRSGRSGAGAVEEAELEHDDEAFARVGEVEAG